MENIVIIVKTCDETNQFEAPIKTYIFSPCQLSFFFIYEPNIDPDN